MQKLFPNVKNIIQLILLKFQRLKLYLTNDAMNTELVSQNNFRKILIDFLKDPDNPVLDFKAAENGLSQYLTMLIPVFKTPEYWTGMSVSISIIIRLFNALMIYYFIRGVHKFGKSN
jgi:ABC-type sugar transport system permease subunit